MGAKAASSPELEAFRALLDGIRQERREAFLARRGDGMAVVTEGWMRFTGERRTPPKPLEPWFDVRQWAAGREFHGPHTMDSPCLEAVEEVPDPRQGQVFMVREPGWYRCTRSGTVRMPSDPYLHDHGDRLYAHGVADRKGCPRAAAAVPTG